MLVAMTHHEHLQVAEAPATMEDLESWDWKAALKREERSLEWLARRTDRSTSTVNAYSAGRLTPPVSWLQAAAIVLGRTVS